jgi:hypothetical protein
LCKDALPKEDAELKREYMHNIAWKAKTFITNKERTMPVKEGLFSNIFSLSSLSV